MKFKLHHIKEGVNDIHPIQKMGRKKASHCNFNKSNKTARAATKFKPNSVNARFGNAGHSSYWD